MKKINKYPSPFLIFSLLIIFFLWRRMNDLLTFTHNNIFRGRCLLSLLFIKKNHDWNSPPDRERGAGIRETLYNCLSSLGFRKFTRMITTTTLNVYMIFPNDWRGFFSFWRWGVVLLIGGVFFVIGRRWKLQWRYNFRCWQNYKIHIAAGNCVILFPWNKFGCNVMIY